MNIKKGKVYLVGAGPGDIDLITIRAIRLIREADVILYDKLINKELLAFCQEECTLVYVGKHDCKHLITQDSINEMLVTHHTKDNIVVRLKGGDPFVFGRGGEEAIYLRERDIEFEIVPGISSSIAVGAYAGIPVTFRGVASDFAVITGHEAPHKKESAIYWKGIIGVNTLVFLMAIHNKKIIAEQLIKAGRKAEDCVAFIRRGTTDNQEVTITTLQGVLEGQADEVHPPAVMIIGDVVKLRDKIKWHFTDINTDDNTNDTTALIDSVNNILNEAKSK